jgi:hypothetical protein
MDCGVPRAVRTKFLRGKVISCSPLHWLLDSASLEARIWVQTGQELLKKWDARAPRLYLRMEVTGEGLALGARTILAKMARDERGAPFLFLEDEQRTIALLTTAYQRPFEPYLLAKLSRA